MASLKRPHTDEEPSEEPTEEPSAPIISMFEHFRSELDEHHDRRERVIKASRDITASSKKIIFSLQRLRSPGALPASTLKDITPHHARIQSLFQSVTPDLQGLNAYRYGRQISGGIQEFMEAVSFQQYIETSTFISHSAAQQKLHFPAEEGVDSARSILLTEEDYLGGLFDLGGEMMRFAVTGMATRARGEESRDGKGDVLGDMRELRTLFEQLDFGRGDGGSKEREKKMQVLRESVEKVEKAVYGLVVRGSERPAGWVPDLEVAVQREVEVE